MKYLCVLAFLLCGCKAVEYFGAVSMETFNDSQEEQEEFAHDISTNQASAGKVIYALTHENILEAKHNEDDQKLDRSYQAKANAEAVIKEADKLADTSFLRAENPTDWAGIIDSVVKTLMGAVLAYFGVSIPMGKKVERLKEKARNYAKSTDENDIKDDKDLS